MSAEIGADYIDSQDIQERIDELKDELDIEGELDDDDTTTGREGAEIQPQCKRLYVFILRLYFSSDTHSSFCSPDCREDYYEDGESGAI